MVLSGDLEACRAALGPPGPERSAWVRSLPPVRRPRWARRDALRRFWDEYRPVLEGGRVAWGSVVQANELLFDPSPNGDAPAEIIHPAGGDDGDPAELSACAYVLFGLRARRDVPEALCPLRDTLEDERQRSFGVLVPEPVSPPQPTALTTTFVPRAWLPGSALLHRVLPVVLPPPGLASVVLLPKEKWPEPLLALWTRFHPEVG